MSDGLLKLLISSDVRKNLLFQLLEEPVSLTELKSRLDMTSSNLIPRLNELKGEDLIARDNGSIRLTFKGAILAKELSRINTLAMMMEKNGRFFNEHDLAPIPEYLLQRIGELGDCRLIENSMENITATFSEVIGRISGSQKVSIISPIFDPEYPTLVLSMSEQKIPVSVIVTEKIFGVLEKGYAGAIKDFIVRDNARLYVVDEARLAFAVTDAFSTMSLYKNGNFDSSINLMSFGQSAVKWGEELFEHYRQKSREIKSP